MSSFPRRQSPTQPCPGFSCHLCPGNPAGQPREEGFEATPERGEGEVCFWGSHGVLGQELSADTSRSLTWDGLGRLMYESRTLHSIVCHYETTSNWLGKSGFLPSGLLEYVCLCLRGLPLQTLKRSQWGPHIEKPIAESGSRDQNRPSKSHEIGIQSAMC